MDTRYSLIFDCRSFSTTEEVLKGARHMVAMQIAHEPVVRQVIRDQLKDRARVTCRPTKKGLKVRFLSTLSLRFVDSELGLIFLQNVRMCNCWMPVLVFCSKLMRTTFVSSSST